MTAPPSELAGRVALVTGAASGIGKAIAQELASGGATVVAADINEEGARDTAASLAGGSARQADISRTDECISLIEWVTSTHGHVDILVNDAGLQHVAPIVEFPIERWEYLVRTMLLGPFVLTRTALPSMIARRWGRIVNIGSIHSLVASPNKSAYVAAKHGLLGLTRATALETGEFEITANLICPAYVRTPLVEDQIADQARTLGIPRDEVVDRVMLGPAAIRRMIEPSEVAAVARFLCSEQASSITGSAQVIDGGWTAR
jgi:3-hydroxybutyrate dehydrogenase